MKYLLCLTSLILVVSCTSNWPKEYVVNEKEFVPEGIAYSKNKQAFYLTSVTNSKILEIDRKTGAQRDFIDELEFGYSPGVGIFVDDERNLLHAIGGYYMRPDSLSSLYTFDLATEQLVKRYDVVSDREHFLNDMIMDNVGNIYLTDSKDSSVFVLRSGADKLELFYKSDEIPFTNGIAISDDNTKLYIASFSKGVRILDIASKKILNKADISTDSQGIDGLEFYRGNLYAVQNGIMDNSFNFRKLILNKNEDAIVGVELIDSHPPTLDVPLTFCIVEKQAVVIGNSNLQFLDQVTLEFNDADSIRKTKLIVYDLE